MKTEKKIQASAMAIVVLLLLATAIVVAIIRQKYAQDVNQGVIDVLSGVHFVEFMPVDLMAEEWVMENKEYDKDYVIFIDTHDQSIGIYQVSDGKIFSFYHTVCRSGNIPPIGTFHVRDKILYSDTGTEYRCWYCCDIQNIYLESLAYQIAASPLMLAAEAGNAKNDIRVELQDAQWIYEHVQIGTEVIIF